MGGVYLSHWSNGRMIIDMLLLGLRTLIFHISSIFWCHYIFYSVVFFSFSHILSWCGWRSKDECFINVSGSGRTEGEHQHSLRVNCTKASTISATLYKTCSVCTKCYTTIRVCSSVRNIGQRWQMVASLQSSVCYRSLTLCCCYCCSTLLLDGHTD